MMQIDEKQTDTQQADTQQTETAGQLIQPIIASLCGSADTAELALLCRSKNLYNAVYALAEQLYVERTSGLSNDVFIRILQQGRMPVFDVQLWQAEQQQHEQQQQLRLSHQDLFENQDADMASNDVIAQHIDALQFDPTLTNGLNETDTIAKTQCEDTVIVLEHSDGDDIDVSEQQDNAVQATHSESHDLQTSQHPVHQHVSPPHPASQNLVSDNALMASDSDENTKMPFFNMSKNARVGMPYQAEIMMQSPIRQAIQIVDGSIKFSHDIGLYFDEASKMIEGQATEVVDNFVIHFKYIDPQSQQIEQGSVQVAINPNPRDLWQDNEPPADLPYAKLHVEHQVVEHVAYPIYAVRHRGRSHAHSGTFCDDDFFIAKLAEQNWSILVVSDGAGSAKFSRQGSKIAVNTVGEYVQNYLQQHHASLDELLMHWQIGQQDEGTRQAANRLFDKFNQTFNDASQFALQDIQLEADKIHATMRDFACTLLVAVVKHNPTQTFVATFAVGDGAICAYHHENEVVLMNEPDGGDHAGQTQFLDDVRKVAKQRTNIRHLQGNYHLMLMTDGISDPFFDSDAKLKDANEWHQFWQQQIQPNLQQAQPSLALLEWSNFYQDGHHDDRTLLVLHAQAQTESPMLCPTTEG